MTEQKKQAMAIIMPLIGSHVTADALNNSIDKIIELCKESEVFSPESKEITSIPPELTGFESYKTKKIVIVDIDGTISKVGDRIKYLQQEPKDWDSFYDDCFEDEPIIEICDLVYNLYLQDYKLIFCTGRRESCREKTLKWINKHFEPEISKFSSLLMRPNKDHRHDTILKPELLINADIELNSIAFVLEDRDSMVEKWREMGLICLQVAKGNF